MKFRLLFLLISALLTCQATAQQGNIYDNNPEQRLPIGVEKPKHRFIPATGGKVDKVRVEPPNWWVGMAQPEVEVMIYDQGIGSHEASLTGANGVAIKQLHRVQNPNYLFVVLEVGPGANPGKFSITLTKGNDKRTYPYEIKARTGKPTVVGAASQQLSSSDFVYLVMPDRFANGDPSNDSFNDLNQVGINRSKMYMRHGGDIQGVLDHLDYLQELGVTALWLNPVMENDQYYESYHGYAVTDFYNIDKRFGSNDLYKKLVDECHKRGIKVVMDIIFNHCGIEHWFIQDMPSEDWVHQWKEFTRPVYRGTINMDPYASEEDTKRVQEGWFDNHMPDLNQENPRLAQYLIQNIVWWTEYSGQDAYRIDTYYYPNQAFMADWARRMQQEYPGIGMFGEVWEHSVPTLAWYTEKNYLDGGFDSYLPSIKDFQVHFALIDALTQPNGWTSGVIKLYYVLSQDFLYNDASKNVLFLDNHDLARFYSTAGEDPEKLKCAYAFMMTTRGTPSLYYGTEILLTGFTNPDGKVRQDFPGGWPGDATNKFKAAGRTQKENEMFDYMKKLANYRKNTPALHTGKLTHFVPEDGVYVYFRHDSNKTVMCIMNTNDKQVTVDTKRYAERMMGFTKAKNVVTDLTLPSMEQIQVGRHYTLVLELMN